MSNMEMSDYLRRYENLFVLTPQRMRIITHVFEETLDKGLKEHGQIVVRAAQRDLAVDSQMAAYDPYLRLRVANRRRKGRLSCP